jgi:hypothetical protein
MTTLRLSLLVLLAFLLSSCNDKAEQEIRDVFDAYNAACDNKNGAAVLELIDDKYIEEIDRVLSAAKTADHNKVFRMRPWERWWIVAIRSRLTKAEMTPLDGRALLKLTIDRGWNLDELGESMRLDLGAITFKKPRATAELLVDFEKTGLRYMFVQINNQWKIDPMCEEEYVDRLIQKLARASGFREDTWIKEFESAQSGKKITEAIWDPPK